MQQNRKLYFSFPDIQDMCDLSFEKLTPQNFAQLYLMFQNDKVPFTDRRFVTYAWAEQYALDLAEYGRTSPKHAAQDWLFLYKKTYAGILHLYDLSLETFADNHRRGWIGFATRPSFRQQGITRKAVRCFIQYIFDCYPLIEYIHAMTLPGNAASQKLLCSVGFAQDLEERHSKAHHFYLLTKEECKQQA